MKHQKTFLLLIVACQLFCLACMSEQDQAPETSVEIIVLFSPNGLGDRGYNDNILTGIFLAAKERGVHPRIICPESYAEAETIFASWVRSETDNRALFVLATNEYTALTKKYFSSNDRADKQVLLFETADRTTAATTFHVCLYGASYLAGSISAGLPHNESAILCATPDDPVLEEAARGFEDGFKANGGRLCRRFYLSQDASGFSMPDAAYQKTDELAREFAFIYPLAGGSNAGVYHYSRENKGLYTAGMDKDCSPLSHYLIYSVVKRMDQLVRRYLTEWIDGKEWPDHQDFGFDSPYVEVILSPGYQDAFEQSYREGEEKALNAENAYENRK